MNLQSFNHVSCIAKGDSGASTPFWRKEDAKVLCNQNHKCDPPVNLPNAKTINGDKVGYLLFQEALPKQATKVRILSLI